MPEKEFRKFYFEWYKENGAKLLGDKGIYDVMLDAWLACEKSRPTKRARDGAKSTPAELHCPRCKTIIDVHVVQTPRP